MSDIQTDFGRRIAHYRKSTGKSQVDFARDVGVSRSYLANVETGANEPSFNFLASVVASTSLSADWVITGVGDMSRGQSIACSALIDPASLVDDLGKIVATAERLRSILLSKTVC
ncbi:MAG: helix-turn-helix transcriptional regulator [Lamprocystis purpurea]|jgi:transcriptional regulator with XRE-family HTH domain|uniref:helix-turn-helix domain-containing protein n=1 Tax=Lamprocystis purpurea TaxID=61598 RepID=UPI00058D7FCC|nr:helix-turn-helix transcriptional regulator [Lamprocystis purpurea]MBV5274436.1 helix-turn-helix transcriptional regulator [Lamprocystis purpurea]